MFVTLKGSVQMMLLASNHSVKDLQATRQGEFKHGHTFPENGFSAVYMHRKS
jgi:hypothetical protein